MKHIPLSHGRAPRQRGFIMIALLVVVTLMLFYVVVSLRVLHHLNRELNVLERAQVKRLVHSPPAAVVVFGEQTKKIADHQQQAP